MIDTSTHVFCLPDLGEGLTEAEIVEWRVAVGDTVAVDQVVVEVETAKAAVEVPVPHAGTVLTLHAGAGTVIGVGSPLITVGSPVAATTPSPAAVPSSLADAAGRPAPDGAAAERYRTEERAGSGNVLIGYGTGHAPAPRRRRARRSAPAPAPAAVAPPADIPAGTTAAQAGFSTASAGPSTAPAGFPGTQAGSPGTQAGSRTALAGSSAAPRVISPLVRRLAREHDVDIAAVRPAAAHGVIRRQDVERFIAGGTAAPPAPAGPGEAERIPLRGLRRAVADKLSRSRTEIPDATTWVDVDATGLIEAREALADRGIGLLALIARICVAGLRRFPELNASVDTAAGEIIRYSYVNLGFAAQTDRGLVVPVVRGADRLSTGRLAAEVARLAGLARSGTVPPEALTGGTFTLNNYGVFGVDGSNAIINYPEAAILGVGRIVDKPWVVGGELAVRKVTQLSLTFDHRVCDGGTAGGFLRYVADCVERPAVLLADL
jgi:2-oxoisovalerate dehydrogenase E2 component (dihydrolipoyl transacylase)